MKRITSLFCVALIFVFSLAAPARADDNFSDFLDVLDYSYIKSISNGSFDDFYFTFSGSSSTICFNNPFTGDYNYVDMVLSWAYTSKLTSVTFGDGVQQYGLTVTHIKDTLYRVYGQVTTQRISDIYLTFNCSGAGPSYCTIYSFRMANNTGLVSDIEAYCEIDAVNDYHAVIHYVPTDEINHRYIETDSSTTNNWFDCFIYTNDWKKYDYIDFWFLFGCTSITSISAHMATSVIPIEVSEIEIPSLGENTFCISIRMDLTGIDRSSNDIPVITINGNLDFDTVSVIAFQGCSGHILSGTRSPLLYFFGQLESWILNLGDRIVAAVGGNSSSANDFQNQLDQELDRLDQAQSVMDSVTKPAIDSIDVSVDQYVSQADIQVLSTPLSIFFKGEIFSKIIIMSILLATVSYTLFGKK